RVGARPATPGRGIDGRRQRCRGRAGSGSRRHPGGSRAPTRSPCSALCRHACRRRTVPQRGCGGMSDGVGERTGYYAERAPESDDWWYRRGRYTRDAERERRWLLDVAELEEALRAFAPRGDVLELAAGTGIWTRRLVPAADRVVSVDAN